MWWDSYTVTVAAMYSPSAPGSMIKTLLILFQKTLHCECVEHHKGGGEMEGISTHIDTHNYTSRILAPLFLLPPSPSPSMTMLHAAYYELM
jgi:hypothetical protein